MRNGNIHNHVSFLVLSQVRQIPIRPSLSRSILPNKEKVSTPTSIGSRWWQIDRERIRFSIHYFSRSLGYPGASAEDRIEDPSGEADDGGGGENGLPIAVAEMKNESGQINADETGDGAGRVHQTEERTSVLRHQILGGEGVGE